MKIAPSISDGCLVKGSPFNVAAALCIAYRPSYSDSKKERWRVNQTAYSLGFKIVQLRI
jgi:hypothetical protein